MQKLRISYTFLNLWKAGKIDDAIIFYHKLAKLTSPAMEEGKKWDEKVNKYVLEEKCLPIEFGGDKLSFFALAQQKWEIDFEDRYELVGVPDVVDRTILYEIKTGKSKDSGDYASDFQVGMYLLLGHLLGKDIEKAIILHYNQHTQQLDRSIVWNTQYERDRAKNFILTLAPEIYSYFEQHSLFTLPNVV